MAIRHTIYDIVGVQFHPESYATPHGIDILRNWIADGFSQ
jgi:anthranilate synthase component 2